jgi:hypothetical protein
MRGRGLRVLLYYDGRSFRALMAIAELAYQHPDVSTMGRYYDAGHGRFVSEDALEQHLKVAAPEAYK